MDSWLDNTPTSRWRINWDVDQKIGRKFPQGFPNGSSCHFSIFGTHGPTPFKIPYRSQQLHGFCSWYLFFRPFYLAISCWLVVSIPLKNISQLEWLFPYIMEKILERGGRKVGGGKYRRDRKREKWNEEKNNKKTKITVSITRTNARSRYWVCWQDTCTR